MAEFFDVVDETGQPTGEIISRDEAHQKGTLHRTAHVWLVKKKPEGYDILLQKRSEEKDSFPGMYDTSPACRLIRGWAVCYFVKSFKSSTTSDNMFAP